MPKTMRPATILQIIPSLDTGGAERSTVEIAAAIVKAGGRAIVATEGGRLAAAIEAAGGEVLPFPAATKNPWRMAANARALARIIREQGIGLVHARSRAPAWSALHAARRAQVAFVTTYHGAYREQGAIKRLYNSVMARGDVVIANSLYTARLIEARYQTPSARLRVIHRGVDTTVFDPAAVTPARRHALLARWGVGEGQRLIVHAARLTGWKGQRTAVAAFAAARARLGDDAVLILAGDTQGRDAYRALIEVDIARHGLADRVRIVGHCDDMPAAFAVAAVALSIAEEPEAFGRVTIEAQAMGCPVIATRLGAPPEIIRGAPAVAWDAITGWLIEARDPAALAAALVDALSLPPEERAQVAARARAGVRAGFSLRHMQLGTLEVYDGLLGTALAAAFTRGDHAATS